jgi:hypothetical protein
MSQNESDETRRASTGDPQIAGASGEPVGTGVPVGGGVEGVKGETLERDYPDPSSLINLNESGHCLS